MGSTVITAQTADGSKKVSFMLNVSKVDITSVTLDKTEAEIGFGRTLQLKVSITPENTTKYKIHWKSENTSVATVDDQMTTRMFMEAVRYMYCRYRWKALR